MSKYHAVRTDGYASKAEARRALELKLLARAGMIGELREQVSFTLLAAAPEVGYKRPLRYIADFVYELVEECPRTIVEDVKGMKTPVYKLKKRLMEQLLGITITETGSTENHPVKLPRVRVKAEF